MAFVITKDDVSNFAMEYLEPIEGKTPQDIVQVLVHNIEATNAITGHIGGCILTAIRTANGKPSAGLIEHWRKDADWESIEVQMMPILTALGELSDLSKTQTLFMDLVIVNSKSGEPYSLQKDDALVSQVIDVQPETWERVVSEQETLLNKQLESSELKLYAIFKTGDAAKLVVVEKWSSSEHAGTRASSLSLLDEKKEEELFSKDVHSATVVCIE
ncbi:hypothetical protein O6H91_08G087400 [Diphasiastrum complanatum]|uniref:Uncharacterized protein n=2 Tax=Diphasiastrum complanatum TaxID=34168 RepID=A0ACC2CZP0_DIPCM|nr:hypothetical protein O6H91_08G086200 [Diphasiastrum complanatum]KAJ7547467.1 hypothetical protein O6H91_08G087400 [Diphasiastrum complanatum]